MSTIDELSIQITASTKQAQNSIAGLISSLTALRQNLTNFGSNSNMSGFGNIAAGLNGIANASKNVDTAGLKSLTNTIKALTSQGEAIRKLDFSPIKNFEVRQDQFSGLSSLAKAVEKLSGSKVSQAANNLPLISNALKSMQGVTIPNFGDDIYILASGLAKLGGKKVVNAQGIVQIAQGLRELQSIGEMPNLAGIKDVASALSRLGGKNVTQAIQNMPQLAVAFNGMIASLSKAPAVSEQTLRLAEAMAQLATASRNTGSAVGSTSNSISLLRGAISAALPTMRKAQRRTHSLASMFGKLYASYFLIIRAFRGLGSAIEASSKLTEVGNVVATVFGEEKGAIEDFASTAIYNFGLAELSAQQYASRFQAMGSAMGITNQQVEQASEYLGTALQGTKREVEGVADSYSDLGDSMADMSLTLTKLTSDYASFFNMDYDDVAKDFESIFTGMTRPMRIYGIDLTENTLKEWAMKQGLDANIDAMTQAEKTMLRYQYVIAHSGKIMNDFAITANTWANVIRTIGQQFVKLGTIIGSGLINTFKPVLIGFRDFMNTFLDLTQKGMNAIGKLLGWQVEIQEVGVSMSDEMDSYADSLDDAAGSAKKLNTQLRGIDELNNLSSSKTGGSGSGVDLLGGLGGASSGGINFKEVPTAFESDINSWRELGEAIRDKIIEGFGSIQWKDLSKKVKLNASGLANFINGILAENADGETIGGAFGSFLAHGINLGFDWLVTYTGTLDWGQIGGNMADFVNNLFENIDVKDMADTVDNLVDGIWKMFKTALFGDKDKGIKGIDGKKVVSKIAEFIYNLDWDTKIILIKALKFKLISASIIGVGRWFMTDGVKALFSKWLEKELAGTLAGDVVKKGATTAGTMVGMNFGQAIVSAFTGELGTMDLSLIAGAGTSAEIGGTAAAGGIAAILATILGARTGLGLGESIGMLTDSRFLDPSAYGDYAKFGGVFTMFKDLGVAIADCATDVDILKGAMKSWGEDLRNDKNVQFWYDPENGVWAKIGKSITDFVEESGEKIYGENGFWAKIYNKGKEVGEFFYGENGVWAKLWDKIKEIWGDIKELFNEGFDVKTPHFEWSNDGGKEAPDWAKKILETLGLPTKLPKLSIEWYANGGYPTTGSLFYAGEAGAELLGTMNGRTTVASNGEITGISDTIRQTSSEEVQLLRQQNMLLQQLLQKEFGITSREIFNSVRSSANEWKKRTGELAF